MKHLLYMSFALLLALGPGGAAAGDGPQDYDGVHLLLAEGYSLDEAVARARSRYRGKVLSAETIQQDNRPVHRIRIIEDGRVRGLRIDGNTGQPLPRAQNQQRPRDKSSSKNQPKPQWRR